MGQRLLATFDRVASPAFAYTVLSGFDEQISRLPNME
jgi:hypothetical protein